MRILIGLTGLILSGQANAEDLSWMEGHWRSEADGRVSEEIWTSGEGGLYPGVNRTISDGQAQAFVFMRIAATGDMEATYCAQPGGGGSGVFRTCAEQRSCRDIRKSRSRRPAAHHLSARG